MDTQDNDLRFRRSPSRIGSLFVGLAGGSFRLTEQRAHLFGVLPFRLILACPPTGVFMLHGQRQGMLVAQYANDVRHLVKA